MTDVGFWTINGLQSADIDSSAALGSLETSDKSVLRSEHRERICDLLDIGCVSGESEIDLKVYIALNCFSISQA